MRLNWKILALPMPESQISATLRNIRTYPSVHCPETYMTICCALFFIWEHRNMLPLVLIIL